MGEVGFGAAVAPLDRGESWRAWLPKWRGEYRPLTLCRGLGGLSSPRSPMLVDGTGWRVMGCDGSIAVPAALD